MEEVEQGEELLMVLHRSRKAYLIEYLCGFILLGLLVALYFNKINLPKGVIYIVASIAILAIGTAEISRQYLRYRITTSKIVVIKGIIKISKKNINFHPLSFVLEISLRQSFFQRIFNYGTVSIPIAGSNAENAFELKDVDNPLQVMEMLERLIDNARRKR